MTAACWEILRSLASLHQSIQAAIDDLLHSRQTNTVWLGNQGSKGITRIEILETNQVLVLKAWIPQAVAETLQIWVTPETLIVSGEQTERVTIPGYCDFAYRPDYFQNLIPLPFPVHPEAVTAELQQDILQLTLPKSGQSRPTGIQIPLSCKAPESSGSGVKPLSPSRSPFRET